MMLGTSLRGGIRGFAWSVLHFRLVMHVMVVLFVLKTESAPVPNVTSYLSKYGYRPEHNLTEAVMSFQKMADLNQTGVVDKATLVMMTTPRCGDMDIEDTEQGHGFRKKRYSAGGAKWGSNVLTYNITKYTSDLTQTQVDDVIEKAFQMWSEVTPLKFERKLSGHVDFEIKFASLIHCKYGSFDGADGVLAHAFFPLPTLIGGDTHFDEDELWTVGSHFGKNLFQVAVHEFGHSLGLGHSSHPSAVMSAFYGGFDPTFKLDEDDIKGIQSLYGPPPVVTTPKPVISTTPEPSPTASKQACVDAIFMDAEGKTYIFQGTQYFWLNDFGVVMGVRNISDDWPFTGPVDCALHLEGGYTYIFKGADYWKFNNQTLISVGKIGKILKGIPENLDAIFEYGGNDKVYVMKDDKYWRFSPPKLPPMPPNVTTTGLKELESYKRDLIYLGDLEYPQPLKRWVGLPSRVDAAFKWLNGRTYFFRGDQYYRFNDVTIRVDANYPKPIDRWGATCP